MKDSRAHPNLEDKSGNPTFASAARVNYSTNDPRSLEPEQRRHPVTPKKMLRLLLQRIFRTKS